MRQNAGHPKYMNATRHTRLANQTIMFGSPQPKGSSFLLETPPSVQDLKIEQIQPFRAPDFANKDVASMIGEMKPIHKQQVYSVFKQDNES
jgi:hypothetical protein